MAAETGSPFCSKVALGFTSFSFTPAPLPSAGDAVTAKSLSAKLPLSARPGPRFASDGSARASSRIAVMPVSAVRAVIV
jgi:hypothetical protein